jgi:hypothetical protein
MSVGGKCRGLFSVQWFELIIRFVDIGGSACSASLFKFSFPKLLLLKLGNHNKYSKIN